MTKFALALMLLAVPLTLAAGADAHSIAARVDEHYNHLHSLQAEFTETYRGSGIDRTEAGTLWLEKAGMKKPGKMRWEYRSPREKLFVSDGRDAWFYVPGDRQARKTSARKLDDLRSPLAFLLGKSSLEKELHGLSLATDVAAVVPGGVVLRGVPQAMAERVSGIQLEIAPDSRIVRIVVEEADGAVTEYRFSQQQENVRIAEGRFQFSPPVGVETVDTDLAQ
jgi:outer membrane lipoprotein carrier protein